MHMYDPMNIIIAAQLHLLIDIFYLRAMQAKKRRKKVLWLHNFEVIALIKMTLKFLCIYQENEIIAQHLELYMIVFALFNLCEYYTMVNI